MQRDSLLIYPKKEAVLDYKRSYEENVDRSI